MVRICLWFSSVNICWWWKPVVDLSLSVWWLKMQAGRLLPIPGRVYDCWGSSDRIREQPDCVQGRQRRGDKRVASNASHTSRSCSQLLGVLLRDSQCPGPSLPAGQECIRWSNCRAGLVERGELPWLDADNAIATRQPHSLDHRHADRGYLALLVLSVVSDIVAEGRVRGSCKFLAVNKSCWKIVVQKKQNLGLKTLIWWKFRGRIEILGTCNFLCRTFASVCSNSVGNLQFLLKSCIFLPHLLFHLWHC